MINTATFYDRLLMISIIVIALASYGIISFYGKADDKNIVTVSQSNNVILKISDEEKKKGGIYKFSFEGGEGMIEIKDEKARMLPMDKSICPNEVCSDTGWIENSPQVIVCLPNKLTVQFSGGENIGIDAVAF